MRIEFKADEARSALSRAQASLRDLTPLYRNIVEYMIPVIRQRFVSGTAPDGTAWPRKSEATLARYRRLGWGNLTQVLVAHGHRLSREVVGAASPTGAVIGSALVYAQAMQEGAARWSWHARGSSEAA